MAPISKKDVLDIIKSLESTSCNVVLQGLIDVKRKIVASTTGAELFIECHGIKYLLRFIRKSNEKILDISLSILGNLCLDKQACEEVTSSPTVIRLLIGMLGVSEKDSITGRTCRLIGNLAVWPSIAIQLHQQGAVIPLTEVLKSEKSSNATKHMAVRALRILWNVHDSRKDMIQDKVVRVVASLLTTTADELLQATLKALASFTCPYSEECALEISGEGEGFTHLVSAITRCSRAELAVKVLLNISLGQTIRPLLGSAGTIQAAIECISDRPPQEYPPDVVLLLCSLSREAANRSKIRLNGGLKILLNSMREAPSSNTQVRSLEALLCFIYDEASLEILLEDGLVTALITKLSTVVKDYGKGPELLVASPCKRSRSLSPTATSKYPRSNSSRCPSDNSDSCSLPRYSSTLSASSPESMSSYSPDSSSSFRLSPGQIPSPSSSLHSDAYSPVYSSDGQSDNEGGSDAESVSGCSSVSVRQDGQSPDSGDEAAPTETASSLSRRPFENCTLLLLSRISHMVQPVKELADTDTIDTLIRYTAAMEKPLPRASRILHRLTRNELYLLPLVLNGFVLKVISNFVNVVHDCWTPRWLEIALLGQALLNQMSVIAETPFGEGELAHQLLCANRPTRSLVILSTAHVVKNRRVLRNLLSRSFCGLSSLELLLQLLKNAEKDGMRDDAIDSISRLARHLGVTAKPVQPISQASDDPAADPVETLADDEVVELVTDDDQTIRAERKLLCAESDYFSAMLSGSFKESGQLNVRLQDVSAVSLSALIRLVERPGDYRCLQDDVAVAFGVLELADRYLMTKICGRVVRWMQSKVKPKNLPFLYMRAVDFKGRLAEGKDLASDVLCYALAGELVRRARLNVFTEILISSYQDVFIDDLRQVIQLKLNEK